MGEHYWTREEMVALLLRTGCIGKEDAVIANRSGFRDMLAPLAVCDALLALESRIKELESERDFILNDASHKEAGFALAAETDRARLARVETAATSMERDLGAMADEIEERKQSGGASTAERLWLKGARRSLAALATALALPGAEGREGEG